MNIKRIITLMNTNTRLTVAVVRIPIIRIMVIAMMIAIAGRLIA